MLTRRGASRLPAPWAEVAPQHESPQAVALSLDQDAVADPKAEVDPAPEAFGEPLLAVALHKAGYRRLESTRGR